MSLFADVSGNQIFNTIAQLGTAYLQSRTASSQAQLSPAMGALPALGALPAVGAAVGGLVVRGGAAIARSAMGYCRRNPAWCASIGGTAAVAGLIESGQLPTIRRRRGRGITPRDLRSFKRVANLIRGFCPTVRRVPTRATKR